MLTAVILICSLAQTPDLRDCTQDNAVDVMKTPVESANPGTCFLQGQAFLAQMELGRDLRDDEGVRIICVHKREA